MKLTRRGEDLALALLAISGAGLVHLIWNLFFSNPLDFASVIGTGISTCLMLFVMVMPMYADEL